MKFAVIACALLCVAAAAAMPERAASSHVFYPELAQPLKAPIPGDVRTDLAFPAV